MLHIHDRVDWSLAVALVCTFLVGISNAITMIPSMFITTLKFRSGAVSSLRDRYFKKYRKALLSTTFLLGGAIWGMIISSIIIFALAFIITFLATYDVSQLDKIDKDRTMSTISYSYVSILTFSIL